MSVLLNIAEAGVRGAVRRTEAQFCSHSSWWSNFLGLCLIFSRGL